MKQYFYYKCFRKTIIEFLNIFNDIRIAKYDTDGNILKYVNVPIKLAPKAKFYNWVYNRSHEKRLPIMSTEITGVKHSNNRVSGKHEKNYIQTVEDGKKYYITPAPYDMDFELKIGTEYINESDQIIEQILPFFNPFVYTKLRIPEIEDEFNIKILFQGLSIDNPTDIAEDELRNIIWTLTFRVQTFLLQPIGDIEEIKKIIYKFYLDKESWAYRSSETEGPSGVGHDSEELFVKGEKDETGKIIVNYEVF